MLTLIARRFGGPDVLELLDRPAPAPGRGQVRIRVAASAINPIDFSALAGRLTEAGLMAPAAEFGLGWDVAGTISAVGEGVASFEEGQAVLALRDLLFAGGAHAEEVVVDATAVTLAPSHATAQQAATLPLNGLTAARALDLTGLVGGQTLLVTGAGGGVGGFALELARLRGVRTVAVARAADEELVTHLGADVFVAAGDRLGQRVRDVVPGGVDAVIDAAVLGIAAHDALRGSGTFVALVAPFAPPPIRGTQVVTQEVLADGVHLAELVAFVDAGRLTLRVAEAFALADARAAYERSGAAGVRGRVVLEPAPRPTTKPTTTKTA